MTKAADNKIPMYIKIKTTKVGNKKPRKVSFSATGVTAVFIGLTIVLGSVI